MDMNYWTQRVLRSQAYHISRQRVSILHETTVFVKIGYKLYIESDLFSYDINLN